MGFFSWKTSDTDESISNVHSYLGALPVKLLSPAGVLVKCRGYDGYGKFRGVNSDNNVVEYDFYQLVHELTDGLEIGSGDRETGINYAFDKEKSCIKPKLVSIDYEGDYDSVADSPDCEFQGYFYS